MPAKSQSALPNPAAVLPGEADVLANVLADLSDHDAKLVYADWLEDRDDPRGPLLRNFVTAYRAGKKLPKVTAAPKPWRDVVGITLLEKLRGTDLAPLADRLLALALPTLAIKSARAAEKMLPVGASRLGGGSDMPPSAEWPTLEEVPLAFLGQFNLTDLSASVVCRDLPRAGLLSVFSIWDEDDANDAHPAEGSWQMLYSPDTTNLTRCLPPPISFTSCRIEYTEQLTLPALDSPWGRELARKIKDESAYCDLLADMCPGDHLLGHPYPIIADVLGKKSVQHLLTLCVAQHAGWPVDGPDLHFTLSADNLNKQRFDRVKLQIQSG